MGVSERRVDLHSGGLFPTLKDRLDRTGIKKLPWLETAAVAPAGANFAVLDSTKVSGNLAIGVGSTENAGIVAALLAGAIGVASTNTIAGGLGAIANKVAIRDASTHDPVIDEATGREVYGLLQAVSTAVDGDPIGAANLQISFVIVDASGVITLVNVDDPVEFIRHALYVDRSTPNYILEGSGAGADAIQGAVYDINQRTFLVTTAFASGEVITLATGAGGFAGIATPVGDTILLPATAGEFNLDGKIQVEDGGPCFKGVDVIWDSTTTFHFNRILDVGDTFTIKQLFSS